MLVIMEYEYLYCGLILLHYFIHFRSFDTTICSIFV